MELANPFRSPDDPRRRRGPNAAAASPEWTRVFVFLVVFVFVLATMIGLKIWIDASAAAPKRPSNTGPPLRQETAEQRTARRIRDLAGAFKDGAHPVEHEALKAFAEAALPERAFRLILSGDADPTALMARPEKYRGSVLRVQGRLKARGSEGPYSYVDLQAERSDIPLRVFHLEPLEEPPAEAAGAPWTAVAAFLRTMEQPSTTLVFLAPRVRVDVPPPSAPEDQAPVRALPDPEVSELFRSLAAKFEDTPDTIVQEIDYESPEFLEAARALRTSLSPEQAARLCKPADKVELAANPQAHQGALVRFSGRLIQIYTRPVSVTNPAGLKQVYEGYLVDLKGPHVPVTFFLIDKPAATFRAYFKEGMEYLKEWVEIEGVFLRRYRYQGLPAEGAGEGPTQTSLVVLAKNLRLIPERKPEDLRGGFAALVGGAGLLLAIIVIVAGVMTRKYGGGGASVRLRMFQIKRKKMAEKGQSTFPEAAPDKQILGEQIEKPPSDPTP
ncbi:MAG: hypothetical protein HY716_06535 [Planctomycetes bacterium]|nr:hypothetical protein [Planctomycetota bacterium]